MGPGLPNHEKAMYVKNHPPDKNKESKPQKTTKYKMPTPNKLSKDRLSNFNDENRIQNKPLQGYSVGQFKVVSKKSSNQAEQDKKRDADAAALHRPANVSPPGKLSRNLSQNNMDLSNVGTVDVLGNDIDDLLDMNKAYKSQKDQQQQKKFEFPTCRE